MSQNWRIYGLSDTCANPCLAKGEWLAHRRANGRYLHSEPLARLDRCKPSVKLKEHAKRLVGLRVPHPNDLFLSSGPSVQKRRQALPSSRMLFLITEHEAPADAAVQSLPGQT